MIAIVTLGKIAVLAREVFHDGALAQAADALRSDIDFGIQTYGVIQHPRCGRIYAYETDGFGNHVLMDDANIPSLLSIPCLGLRRTTDHVYTNARRFVLSPEHALHF